MSQKKQQIDHVTQAVILVGGKGTRLGHLTQDMPKPMMPISETKLFLDILIQEVTRYGIRQIILLAGHLGDSVCARYHDSTINGCAITVQTEERPMGTAGALTLIKEQLAPMFFLLNGDSLFDIPLPLLSRKLHTHSNALLCMALKTNMSENRYGNVSLDGDHVSAFDEKGQHQGDATINAGVYLCRREIIDVLPDTPASLEQEIFPLLLSMRALVGVTYDGYFIDIGLPNSLEQGRRELPRLLRRPAIFFDRDNTLNIDTGYTHKTPDLKWIKGAKKAIKAANDCGYLVIIVTNQSGIARGLYTVDQMHEFHDEMQKQLSDIGAHIDAFYWCPFHKDAALPAYAVDCHPDRKPNPGMIEKAISEWTINVRSSFLIGDSPADISAASKCEVKSQLIHPDEDLSVVLEQVLLK